MLWSIVRRGSDEKPQGWSLCYCVASFVVAAVPLPGFKDCCSSGEVLDVVHEQCKMIGRNRAFFLPFSSSHGWQSVRPQPAVCCLISHGHESFTAI